MRQTAGVRYRPRAGRDRAGRLGGRRKNHGDACVTRSVRNRWHSCVGVVRHVRNQPIPIAARPLEPFLPEPGLNLLRTGSLEAITRCAQKNKSAAWPLHADHARHALLRNLLRNPETGIVLAPSLDLVRVDHANAARCHSSAELGRRRRGHHKHRCLRAVRLNGEDIIVVL